MCVCVSNTCCVTFRLVFFHFPAHFWSLSSLYLHISKTKLVDSGFTAAAVLKVELHLCDYKSCGISESYCPDAVRNTVTSANDCKVKQTQMWCFIKICLCTPSHYASATAKDVQKTLYGRCGICACTAQQCFSFYFSHTTFVLLRGFSLVAVVMEECHISLWLSLWGLHSVSSNLSNCIFRLPPCFFFFLF